MPEFLPPSLIDEYGLPLPILSTTPEGSSVRMNNHHTWFPRALYCGQTLGLRALQESCVYRLPRSAHNRGPGSYHAFYGGVYEVPKTDAQILSGIVLPLAGYVPGEALDATDYTKPPLITTESQRDYIRSYMGTHNKIYDKNDRTEYILQYIISLVEANIAQGYYDSEICRTISLDETEYNTAIMKLTKQCIADLVTCHTRDIYRSARISGNFSTDQTRNVAEVLYEYIFGGNRTRVFLYEMTNLVTGRARLMYD